MISEHKFVTSFTSIWREVMPLGDSYWRRENLLLLQKHPKVANLVAADMRGLANELAFMAFCKIQTDTSVARSIGKLNSVASISDAVSSCVPQAVEYINRLAFSSEIRGAELSKDCGTEAHHLTENLLRFFPADRSYELRPKFNGCGVISSCEGDLISGGCLFEIKAGDRSFRIADIRQLLVYAALAYAGRTLNFDRIALCNPRTGILWTKSLDSICHAVSGLRASDVLAQLVLHFESTDTTK